MTIAGKHQDVFIYRLARAKVEVISNDGSWVGILPDTTGVVTDLDVAIEKGDTVLLLTDGATEAMNAAGQMFGEDAIAALFERVASMPLEQAVKAILDEVLRYQVRQDDDITLLMLRRVE